MADAIPVNSGVPEVPEVKPSLKGTKAPKDAEAVKPKGTPLETHSAWRFDA